jgi:hypothetical protein
MKRATLVLIISLISYCYPQCLAQQANGIIHFEDEMSIFFDSYKNTLKNKRVSLIYFALPREGFLPDSLYPPIRDTIFYALRKNGQISYKLVQNIMYSSDSSWFKNYDTIIVGVNCKQRYYCDCGVPGQYDSIVCNAVGLVTFSKQATLTRENIYSSVGLLIEQKIRDLSPDGSFIYKTFYKYDKYRRLISVELAKGQPSQKWNIGDTYSSLEFHIVSQMVFSYNERGLMSTVSRYWVDNGTKTPIYLTSYTYVNDLLTLTEMCDYNGEVTYAEKVGYKFY